MLKSHCIAPHDQGSGASCPIPDAIRGRKKAEHLYKNVHPTSDRAGRSVPERDAKISTRATKNQTKSQTSFRPMSSRTRGVFRTAISSAFDSDLRNASAFSVRKSFASAMARGA